MKRIVPALSALILAYVAFFAVNTQAMVAVSQSNVKNNSEPRHMNRESTGFFGGVKNNRLLLMLSESVRQYFGVNGNTKVMMNGRPIGISELPLNAHIRVVSEKAVVLRIEVLEGGK